MKTLDKFENVDESFKERKYVNDEVYYYLGEEYKLKIVEDKNTQNNKKNYCHIDIKEKNLIITTTTNDGE